MTIPIKKQITTELFIDRMEVHYLGRTHITNVTNEKGSKDQRGPWLEEYTYLESGTAKPK